MELIRTEIPRDIGHGELMELRRGGIGASEVPAVLGLSPFASREQLWRYKTGRQMPPDISRKPAVVVGKALEGPLIDAAATIAGRKVRHEGNVMYRSPAYPHLWASPDGWYHLGGNKWLPIEAKTTRAWTEPPPYVLAQVQQQLLVTGAERCWLIGLCSGELQWWYIEASESWHEVIIDASYTFWRLVEEDRWDPEAFRWFDSLTVGQIESGNLPPRYMSEVMEDLEWGFMQEGWYAYAAPASEMEGE